MREKRLQWMAGLCFGAKGGEPEYLKDFSTNPLRVYTSNLAVLTLQG